jgi:hypothetical protein
VRVVSSVIALTLLLGAYGCGSSQDDGPRHCKTTLAYETGPKPGYSSPSSGILALEGTFFSGESVTIYYRDDGGGAHNESATLTAGTSALSYGGLPSGTRYYSVYVTCAASVDEAHTLAISTVK